MAVGAPGPDPHATGHGRTLVVISYFTESSHYPRSGRREDRHAIYWTNIAASVATLRHVGEREAEVIVFAGDDPPARPAKVLHDAGAEIRHLAFRHQPPEDFYYRYVGSLYLLDVMEALAEELDPEDTVIFVDPDVVWLAPLGPLVEEIRRDGVVAYHLDVPESLPMCHLSRREQGEILATITGSGPAADAPAYRHFGGELYGMRGSVLGEILPPLAQLWEATMGRYRDGLPHYNVEEHLMNAVLWQRDEQDPRGNQFIERIITAPPPRGSRHKARPGLLAWHLPIEKDRGLLRVFRRVASGRPLPPPGPKYTRWLARRVGVHPTPARWLTDRARKVAWATVDRRDKPSYGI